MDDHSDLLDALSYIDPAELTYQEWVEVGMALKESGLPFEAWDEWSRRDGTRYKGDGGMLRKWEGFGDYAGSHVGSGTIAQMAMNRGWDPWGQPDEALDWDSEIIYMGEDMPGRFIDRSWVEPTYIEAPTDTDWDPVGELSSYISALFDENEYVGFVTETWEKDGKWMPTKGVYTMTAGDILRALARCGGDMGAAIGDCNPQAGAWIRFNPLNGKGVKNSDVTDYRYALVECDTIPKEMQLSLIRELELPCAAIVDSGNKSVHAIVRIDAADYGEYRKRVDQLYDVCKKNGLALDTQNKNPSRLSRMPGVVRGGGKQHLIATKTGKEPWSEWWEWVQAVNDDLPDPELLSDTWGHMPDLAAPLIDGVLRQGHKMLLSGPSKAGKSFALIELCIAIAEGREWFGWRCAQGRVLYVNLELDRASCLHRFRDVYAALGWEPKNVGSIDVWNLRGHSVPMDKLAPKLVRRAAKKGYVAVVIDPIYKVITGDENSASEMAAFCNQFDAIATQLKCAVIYCHHHSKGFQGMKSSVDRASGSGVFARDPDAILDMLQLSLTDSCRAARCSAKSWAVIQGVMDQIMPGWREVDEHGAGKIVPVDAQAGPVALCAWAADHLPKGAYAQLLAESERVKKASSEWTAWRIEGTLREFPSFPPKCLWFDYPLHEPDADGSLSDLKAEGEYVRPGSKEFDPYRKDGIKKASEKNKENSAKRQSERVKWMRDAIAQCKERGIPATRENVRGIINDACWSDKEVTRSMMRNWTSEKSEWSPIRIGDGDELRDTDDEAVGWDDEITA